MLINLTPHPICLADEGGAVIATFPPSGRVARVATTAGLRAVAYNEGTAVPIYRTEFGSVEGLPEPQEGVLYIASSIVAQAAAAAGRRDVVAPDTGPTAIRNGGQIVAVRRLQAFGEVALPKPWVDACPRCGRDFLVIPNDPEGTWCPFCKEVES